MDDGVVLSSKKRKAKAEAAERAMQVVRRSEMKMMVVVCLRVGFDGSDEESVLNERSAVD